jgi:hypothetical protein
MKAHAIAYIFFAATPAVLAAVPSIFCTSFFVPLGEKRRTSKKKQHSAQG